MNLNQDRMIELGTRAARKMQAAQLALDDYKSARDYLRAARKELREANRALRAFLAGKDDGQMPLALQHQANGAEVH